MFIEVKLSVGFLIRIVVSLLSFFLDLIKELRDELFIRRLIGGGLIYRLKVLLYS
jgi:hypothetical protein